MSDRRLNILASPGFLLGLCLLLLNDFALKERFSNQLTGKLSDFAGLFAFPLFWTAFFPRRKIFVYVLTAAAFIFWKSTYSQFLIDGWNSFPFPPLERTVDYSDLLALLILPFSYAYSFTADRVPMRHSAIYLIALVSVFAFAATSFSKKTPYNNEYLFPMSKKDLAERMKRLNYHDVNLSFEESDTFQISFSSCTGTAIITLSEKDNQSIVTLKELDYRCPGEGEKQVMLEYFEREFIEKLKAETVEKSPQVPYIWPLSSPPGARSQPTPGQSGSQN